MNPSSPSEDYSDVIGRLLVRVYEIHRSAIYFLHERGYPLQRPLPQDEVIRFCVQVAEEAARQAEGEHVRPKTIPEIAAWVRGLLGVEERENERHS